MGTRGSADVIVRFNPIQLMDDYLISIRSHSSILLYVLRFMVLTAIWRLLMDASGRSMGKASTRITTGRCWNPLLWFVVPFLGSSHDSHIFLSRLSHPKKLHTFMCTHGTQRGRHFGIAPPLVAVRTETPLLREARQDYRAELLDQLPQDKHLLWRAGCSGIYSIHTPNIWSR